MSELTGEVREAIQNVVNEALTRLREEFRNRLPYEAGRARGEKVGWCRVEFQKKFRDPAVICTLESWTTGCTPPKIHIEPPMVSIPPPPPPKPITFPVVPSPPSFSFTLPNLPRGENYAETLRSNVVMLAVLAYFTDWGVFNSWKNEIVSGILALGYIIGSKLNDAWDKHFAPYLKRVEEIGSKVNSSLSSMSQDISNVLTGLRDRAQQNINEVLNTFHKYLSDLVNSTNNTLNEFAVKAASAFEDSVNQAIEKLYELLALERGVGFTPAIIRNVSGSGFEFWCPKEGVVANYLAVECGKLELERIRERFEVLPEPPREE